MFNGNRFEYNRETATGKVVREVITMPTGISDDIMASIKESINSHEYGDVVDIRTFADAWLVGSGYCKADKQTELSVGQWLIDFRKFRVDFHDRSLKDCVDDMDAMFDALRLPYSGNNGRVKKLASLLGIKKAHKRTTGNVDITMRDDRSFYVAVCSWMYATFQCKFVAETTYTEVKAE